MRIEYFDLAKDETTELIEAIARLFARAASADAACIYFGRISASDHPPSFSHFLYLLNKKKKKSPTH